MSTSKAAWLAELRDLLACSQLPCCLVECEGNFGQDGAVGQHQPQCQGRVLKERVVCTNASWLQLYEYEEGDVVGRSFSEIRGFQGPLTSKSSKLRFGTLLIAQAAVYENLHIVNYTSRTRRPLDVLLRVNIFKRQGRNIFFMCSVVRHQEVVAGSGGVPAGLLLRNFEEPAAEPEPETWRATAGEFMATSGQPCILVACYEENPRGILRERIVGANERWYELFEYEESDIAHKSFSEVRGFQGPLTGDASKLRLGSLLITEAAVVEKVTVVNYTGRTSKALEVTLRVTVFKQGRRNVAFLCTVAAHSEVLDEDYSDGTWSRQSSEGCASPPFRFGEGWSRETTEAVEDEDQADSPRLAVQSTCLRSRKPYDALVSG